MFPKEKVGPVVPPPPPPPYTSSNISRTPWATDLKLYDIVMELIFNKKDTEWVLKKISFQPPPPTLGYHSNVQSWRMFLKTHFGSFRAKDPQNSTLFCYSHEECPKCSLLWKFGLDIPLDGVLVTVFVSHSFSCFIDHKLGNTISMAPWMVSFELVFMIFQKKLLLLTFNKGNKVFQFWIGIPSQKSETYEPP